MPGYDLVTGTTHLLQQNPILLRIQDRLKMTGFEVRQMCDAVGSSPARMATLVTYDVAGQHRAHLQTHLNAHIESAGQPLDLPRVKEAIRHMVRLEQWALDLRTAGYLLTISGDFNFAWSLDDTHDWTYSPEAVFQRLGFATSFDSPTVPAGGTLGGRRVDYMAYDPFDLTITGQALVAGEHSDHAWPRIETITQGEPA
jgi:hypothetical protein